MWYHIDIWVETSQLSPNASLLSTITLALSLTPICFQGKMHHIWSLTFVDENIDESTIRWLRWRGRRYDHNIWAGVVLPVRGIEEIRLMLSSASNGNNVANPFFHQYSRKFFDQTHFFIFSKHNQICETVRSVSESFWFFSTLRVSCLKRRKSTFEKCHLTKLKVAFVSSCPTNKKFFVSASVRVFETKEKCSLFDNLSKSEHFLFHCVCRSLHHLPQSYDFHRIWSREVLYKAFHVTVTHPYKRVLLQVAFQNISGTFG